MNVDRESTNNRRNKKSDITTASMHALIISDRDEILMMHFAIAIARL